MKLFFKKIGTSISTQHENTQTQIIKFPIITDLNGKRIKRTLLKLNIEGLDGNSPNMILSILGLRNAALNFDQTWSAWDKLNVLKQLSSGQRINKTNQNFINWSSNLDPILAGHLTGNRMMNNQVRYVDVTDYVQSMQGNSQKSLVFLIYRPFRYGSFVTGAGEVKADDLSLGSALRVSSNLATNCNQRPQLIHFTD